MTFASDADRWPDHQTPLDVLAHFTGSLGGAADLPEQLCLTADVLRRALGDVTVTHFTLTADRWQPMIWQGQAQAADDLPADLPTLLRIFEE